jgi:hypothetical protein
VTIKGKQKEKYEPTRSKDKRLMVISMTNISTKTTLKPAIKFDKSPISAPLDAIYNDSEKQQKSKLHESLSTLLRPYHFLHLGTKQKV